MVTVRHETGIEVAFFRIILEVTLTYHDAGMVFQYILSENKQVDQ